MGMEPVEYLMHNQDDNIQQEDSPRRGLEEQPEQDNLSEGCTELVAKNNDNNLIKYRCVD